MVEGRAGEGIALAIDGTAVVNGADRALTREFAPVGKEHSVVIQFGTDLERSAGGVRQAAVRGNTNCTRTGDI